MSYFQETFTPEIKWQQDLVRDLKLKLSSMLSSTEQGMEKSEASLVELRGTAQSLSKGFYEIHLLLKVYENELDGLLAEVTCKDSTEEEFTSGQDIVH